MTKLLASLILAGLAGCATTPREDPEASPPEVAAITYFDRNSDLRVDYEVHDFGCCDRNWALIDSDFDGRYDTKIRWGFAVTRENVEQPVPTGVLISPGKPESSY